MTILKISQDIALLVYMYIYFCFIKASIHLKYDMEVHIYGNMESHCVTTACPAPTCFKLSSF